MDFRFAEEQTVLRDLAREILEGEVSPERLKQVEGGTEWFDRELWSKLAEANLLGLAVPETQGGMGMGFLELCTLLVELGRVVAPVPVLPTLVLGGLPLARFGDAAQQERWLPPLVRGEIVLTAALDGPEPVLARREGDGWKLAGARSSVPAAALARRVIVPARTDAGERLFLVDPEGPNVALEPRRTSHHERLCDLRLTDTEVAEQDLLGDEEAAGWLRERALVALAATQVGVSERALEITTDYVKGREQFGAPLGALPAVQHRLADCYIALDAMRWVTWSAAWKLALERPAARDAWIAKFWAADAGSRIGTATQHLHGGMGVDMDYPIHRYFLWSKSLELALGAATPQLVELGRDMARGGPQELV